MEANNLTIIPPEGMEAYQEGNDIKFRPIKKGLTYKDIARELFDGKDVWRIVNYNIDKYNTTPNWDFYTNCTSEKQAKKLLAINKLMNVAKYLNSNWQPSYSHYCDKWYIYIYYDCEDDYKPKINIGLHHYECENVIYFKSKELAQQAIDILGEETIKLALSTDW